MTNRKKIISIIIIAVSSISFSFSARDETLELYVKCISLHIEHSKSSIRNVEKQSVFFDTINIIDNEIIELPNSIKDHKLRLIDSIVLSLIDNNNSIHAIKILPIRIENGKITITLGDYIVNRKNGSLFFSYGGGRKFYFKYDCSKGKYIFLKSEIISF
jgi:hypothetical protein